MAQQPIRPTPINPAPVDFGPNVIVFDPSVLDIQQQTNNVLSTQKSDQFGTARNAFFFKPGVYNNLTVEIGYYTTVHGLGALPDDVTISGGGVQSAGIPPDFSALNNFWRGVENLSINPSNNGINKWAVSQATYMRRVHIKGQLFLWDFLGDKPNPKDNKDFSSGGFIADCVVDTNTISGSQQQFLTRNTNVGNFPIGVWNMVFVGDLRQPSESTFGLLSATTKPFTVTEKTPIIREKPYLTFDVNKGYSVQVPALAKDTQGSTWSGPQPAPATSIPINQFYIAKPEPNNADNAANLNAQLQAGYHLILTPGIYPLASSLQVNYPCTCILGLGLATLMPTTNIPAMEIADVDGVSVSGVLFDAGPQTSPTPSPSLLIVGAQGCNSDHHANPTALFDISCRVGGAAPVAAAQNCVTINSNNVIMDNIWLWRADHGVQPTWTGWTVNPSENGLTVNGNDVTAYGLFVEHFQGFQTLWNGERGSTYFYQSEIPYDVPSQSAWIQPDGENGFPSYKVSDNVTSHIGRGLGVYCNFLVPNIQLQNAISTPTAPGIDMHHMVTVWLGKAAPTSINHIINGTGGTVSDVTTVNQPAFL